MLVGASPDDPVWGIGLAASDPRAQSFDSWKGENLLGKVLMRVRDRLKGPVLIGIAGATRSGKTTLASELAKSLGIGEQYIIHQDKSWKAPNQRPWNDQFKKRDMECPDAVDWNRLKGWIRERMDQAKRQAVKYVIVEGFLLFSVPEVRDLFQKKIFVAVPKQVAYERRVASKFVREAEFDGLIWPSFLRYNECVLTMNDVFVCDGCARPAELAAECRRFIEGGEVKAQRQRLTRLFEDQRRRERSPDDRQRRRSPSPRQHRKRSRSRSRDHSPRRRRRSRSRSRERERRGNVRTNALVSNYDKHSSFAGELVVLVTTGAYCPPHKVHFEMFREAKEFLERRDMKVIAGFMSPSHDAYLEKKNGNVLFSGRDRLKMVELGLTDSDWVRASDWEMSQRSFTDYPEVVKWHKELVRSTLPSNARVKVMYVCGSDQAVRTRLYARSPTWCDGVVIISRPGEGWKKLQSESLPRNFYLVDTHPVADVSSTEVRRRYAGRESFSELVPDKVAQFLLK
jgi:nicotinate (nicotinamide) nucleotide adenylyltransferase